MQNSDYLQIRERYFDIDEVHKYSVRLQEIQNIYDTFPTLKIIFTDCKSTAIKNLYFTIDFH